MFNIAPRLTPSYRDCKVPLLLMAMFGEFVQGLPQIAMLRIVKHTYDTLRHHVSCFQAVLCLVGMLWL